MRASIGIVGVLAGAAIMALSSMIAVPATAAPATGCKGEATSFDADGRVVDRAAAPGRGGTDSDPFKVDVDGTVRWSGSTNGVIKNGSYTVTVSGFEVASGDFDNSEGKQQSSGTEDVGARLDEIPVLGWLTKSLNPVAVVKAEYEITGEGGSCTGSVVIQIGDDPEFTPLWLFSIAAFLGAFALLFWPGAWTRGGAI